MRLGIKGKQVLGVTSIVGVVVVLLSILYLADLARVSLEESRARAELVANAILHRAGVVVTANADPVAAYRALHDDPGLRSILESSLYAKNVTIAVLSAWLLAQLLLRPIHVIRSGLTRLGKGELGVRLDLSQDDEFGELGTFFNTVSAQLSADRSQMAGQVANLESAVQHLEDAVAIATAPGELLFPNPWMRALTPSAEPSARLDTLLAVDYPLRS